MTASVALVVHGARNDALELAETTAARLSAAGIEVARLALRPTSREEGDPEIDALEADLFVSLGGDGTFLRTARRAHATDTPILGLNFGRVGYLLDMPPADLDQVITATLAGDVECELRVALEVSVAAGGSDTSHVAINELSAEKTVPGHVVRLAARIDDEPFLTYAADGVLVATPTGSTAYNLSAGGPVLAPMLDAFVMTPVAAHLVLDRSVVLQGTQVVSLDVVGDRPVVCVLDGVSVATLAPGDAIEVCRHERLLKVATLDPGMGRRLRESLRQGHE